MSGCATWVGLLALFTLGVPVSAPAAASSLRAVGKPFRISHTGGPQRPAGGALQALARDPVSGRVLTVWGILEQDGGTEVLLARMLNADGRPLELPFDVYGFGVGLSDTAVAARGPRGGFVVAAATTRWTGYHETAEPVLLTMFSRSGQQGRVRNLWRGRPGGGTRSVALSVDPATGHGVVAWVGEGATGATVREGLGVYAQALVQGRPAGPVRHIATGPPGGPDDIGGLGLAFRPRSRTFLAVWDQVARVHGKHHLAVTVQAISLRGRLLRRRRMAISRHFFRGDRAGPPAVLPDAMGDGASVFLSTSGHGDYATSRVMLLRLGARATPHPPLRLVGTDPGSDRQSGAPAVAAGPSSGPGVLAYSEACWVPYEFECPVRTPVVGQTVPPGAAPAAPTRLTNRGASGVNDRVSLVRTGHDSYLLATRSVIGPMKPCAIDDNEFESPSDFTYCQQAEVVVRRLVVRP